MAAIDRDVRWTACIPLFRKHLLGGETSAPPELLMRQKVDGSWQYRRPTEDEAAAYVRDEAW